MPVIHETDRRFDELGAAISRRFIDMGGKVEVTRNPPDRDPYQGDGRSALGDAQVTHHCANCEATERKLEQLRTAVIAYVAARAREENSSAEAFTEDWFAAWEATEDAFAALKAAAGIATKCKQNEGGIR